MTERKTETTPCFTGRNVPVNELAKALGVSAQTVRVEIQQKVLPFTAFKREGSRSFCYICPDKTVFEFCGYFRDVSAKEQSDER